ncbi:MAG: hypothetical protein AAFX50_13960, partial [Acidobacteriota bacterium]
MTGGTHGGLGQLGSDHGEAYGSPYHPRWSGGGGGSFRQTTQTSTTRGGTGGGVVEITADDLVIDGEILTDGALGEDDYYGGAGGSVLIDVDRLSGSGTVKARGADGGNGAGGGGRIAVHAGELLGFDPALQLDASGGTDFDNTAGSGYGEGGRAGAGTIFIKTAASTYGDLRVDAKESSDVPGRTVLPSLGEHTVGTADVDADQPADLWIEPLDPAARFDLGVEGLWARVDGVDYRILEEAGDRRRVLLESAAGAVQVGDEVRGVHKFDRVHLADGGRLDAIDPIEVGELTTAGAVGLEAQPTVGGDFVVGGGARLEVGQPAAGQRLRVEDGGVLTVGAQTTLSLDFADVDVRAGGAITVSGAGYAGGVDGARGESPEGALGSPQGGTHGGNGRGADASSETFGSVKRPRHGGGGAGGQGFRDGGDGGGVLEIVAQTLTLDGALLANGAAGQDNKAGGAGGSIYLEATDLVGAGVIEARGAGGDLSGGGGRVAIVADTLTLDPTTQVHVDSVGDGGSGTLFVRTASSTWGDLHLDGGAPGQGS